MKNLFLALMFVAFCEVVYAGCPNGICNLKKSPVVESYTVAPASQSIIKTTNKTTTKTRSYRVSKWR